MEKQKNIKENERKWKKIKENERKWKKIKENKRKWKKIIKKKKKSWEHKVRKKLKHVKKHFFLKVVGDALGVLIDQQTTQKNYSEVVTTKKKLSELNFATMDRFAIKFWIF